MITNRHGAPVDRSPDEDPIVLLDDKPLVEWIPVAIPGSGPPYHLEPFPTMLDKAIAGESVRVLCSCPIRHWKSTTVKSAVAKALRKDPTLHIIVMTHTHDFAKSYGRELRDLCRSLGIRIARGADTILDWNTEEGGGVFVMSNKQSALGRPCNIFIFDDPLASFEDALSADVRDYVDWVISQYTARLSKNGSVLGIMSRLHPDDPIGRREGRQARSWTSIHKSALVDEGLETERALAPHIMSLEHLRSARAELAEADPSEMTWYCQFQNDPRESARGLFKGKFEFTGTAIGGRIAIGVDAAFSIGKARDYFAAVVLNEIQVPVIASDVIEAMRGTHSAWVVSHVERHQRGTSGMVDTLGTLGSRYEDAQMFSYVSGGEIGVYQQLAEQGILVHRMAARYAKEYRARPTASMWEAGRILVVPGQPWTSPFLRELHSFTGALDGQDDQVDALVSAFDGLKRGAPRGIGSFTRGKRVM